jgi:hypothetical protein
MELEGDQLVRDLLELLESKSPAISCANVYPLLERTQASMILALRYGSRVPPLDEPLHHKIIETQVKVTYMKET